MKFRIFCHEKRKWWLSPGMGYTYYWDEAHSYPLSVAYEFCTRTNRSKNLNSTLFQGLSLVPESLDEDPMTDKEQDERSDTL
ncbi:MAG: hypothetical protein ACWGQW_25145 [bacterium]